MHFVPGLVGGGGSLPLEAAVRAREGGAGPSVPVPHMPRELAPGCSEVPGVASPAPWPSASPVSGTGTGHFCAVSRVAPKPRETLRCPLTSE